MKRTCTVALNLFTTVHRPHWPSNKLTKSKLWHLCENITYPTTQLRSHDDINVSYRWNVAAHRSYTTDSDAYCCVTKSSCIITSPEILNLKRDHIRTIDKTKTTSTVVVTSKNASRILEWTLLCHEILIEDHWWNLWHYYVRVLREGHVCSHIWSFKQWWLHHLSGMTS